MELLPKSLVNPLRRYFYSHDRLAIFLTTVTICSNGLSDLNVKNEIKETSVTPTKKFKFSKKKEVLEDNISNDLSNSDSSQDTNSNLDHCYNKGIFPKKFSNKNILTLCGRAINQNLLENPDLLLDHQIALDAAAWYWTTHGITLKNKDLVSIAKALEIEPLNEAQFDSLYRQYSNYVESY